MQESKTARASARDRQSVYKGKREYRCKRVGQHVQVQDRARACTKKRESTCKRERETARASARDRHHVQVQEERESIGARE